MKSRYLFPYFITLQYLLLILKMSLCSNFTISPFLFEIIQQILYNPYYFKEKEQIF